MADELAALGIRSFGVATLAEGISLRRQRPNEEIILFGGASWLGHASVGTTPTHPHRDAPK